MKQLFTFLLTFTLVVFADPPTKPDVKTFFETAQRHWSSLPQAGHSATAASLVQGSKGFLEIENLIRGQDQVSVDNMLAKLEEKIAAKDVVWDAKQNKWTLNHDNGKSSVPGNDPIKVIKSDQGFVVIDGHHDLFLALYLGAKTIAVEVEEVSQLPPLEFWKRLIAKKQVYLPETAEELAKKAPPMFGVRDNPNRYLASLLALKAEVSRKGDALKVLKAKALNTPIWIKINNSIPFIEFYIAEVLTKAGILYNSSWGKKIPEEAIERSRRALVDAMKAGSIEELKLIPLIATSAEAEKLKKGGEALSKTLHAFAESSPQCRISFNSIVNAEE